MEGKVMEKHRIQTRYAIDLFTNKCFKEAMREFIKLETDPCKTKTKKKKTIIHL